MKETKKKAVLRMMCFSRHTIFSIVLAFVSVSQAKSYEKSFCTFMGGGKWERVQSVYVDADDYIYVAGSTKSPDFPVTAGAYDTAGSGNGTNDGFVAKLAPDGSRIIWSTYLHGTSRDDVYGVYADARGFVYAIGWTRSSNFPTTPGAWDRTHNGDMDVFVAKLKPDGSGLVFSTFLGGSGTDQCRGGMCIDETGIYVCGYTDSPNFPATAGAIQRTFQGGYGDAFIAKLSADASSVLFCTYLGSSGPDHAFPGLCVHSDGSIIVTGLAGAADFPTTANAYQTKFAGSDGDGIWYGDAFIARFSLTPEYRHVLHYITFLGGSGDEKSTAQHGLAIDEAGNAIVAGTTHSSDFPTTPGAVQANLKGKNNVYVAKVSLDGTTLLGSTYMGGSPQNGYEPSGLYVDHKANVYVGGSIFGDAAGHPVTSDAFRQESPGANDAFFAVLSEDLTDLKYSSLFGAAGDERIRDLWLSPSGAMIFGGDTYSTNLPVTTGAFQKKYVGGGDAYVAKFDPVRTPAGDVNDDNCVDFLDVVQMAAEWLTNGFLDSDLNDNDRVDMEDYSILAKHWLQQYIP
jgi:hypothetical protein